MTTTRESIGARGNYAKRVRVKIEEELGRKYVVGEIDGFVKARVH